VRDQIDVGKSCSTDGKDEKCSSLCSQHLIVQPVGRCVRACVRACARARACKTQNTHLVFETLFSSGEYLTKYKEKYCLDLCSANGCSMIGFKLTD
jgi:hypothetical protein